MSVLHRSSNRIQCSYNTKLFEQLDSFLARTPCWCCPASRLLAYDVRQDLYTLLQDISLLLFAQSRHELVGIAVECDLMIFVNDFPYLLRERLCGVSWCKPCGLDVILVPEIQKSVNSHCCTKNASGYISWIGRSTGLGIQPRQAVSNRR
jgi:hypothetical protein